jgi:hypothetical protein
MRYELLRNGHPPAFVELAIASEAAVYARAIDRVYLVTVRARAVQCMMSDGRADDVLELVRDL